jgi:hypothetical protein
VSGKTVKCTLHDSTRSLTNTETFLSSDTMPRPPSLRDSQRQAAEHAENPTWASGDSHSPELLALKGGFLRDVLRMPSVATASSCLPAANAVAAAANPDHGATAANMAMHAVKSCAVDFSAGGSAPAALSPPRPMEISPVQAALSMEDMTLVAKRAPAVSFEEAYSLAMSLRCASTEPQSSALAGVLQDDDAPRAPNQGTGEPPSASHRMIRPRAASAGAAATLRVRRATDWNKTPNPARRLIEPASSCITAGPGPSAPSHMSAGPGSRFVARTRAGTGPQLGAAVMESAQLDVGAGPEWGEFPGEGEHAGRVPSGLGGPNDDARRRRVPSLALTQTDGTLHRIPPSSIEPSRPLPRSLNACRGADWELWMDKGRQRPAAGPAYDAAEKRLQVRSHA